MEIPEILKCQDLTYTERYLYAHLVILENNNLVDTSTRRLENITGMSRNLAHKTLQSLRDKGFIWYQNSSEIEINCKERTAELKRNIEELTGGQKP